MYDLIIIGSGPAGLSAAVYAKRAGLDALVMEKSPMSGGQVLTTYEVDNYLGMPGINGYDLGMKFREHADRMGVEFLETEVSGVERIKNRNRYEENTSELVAASNSGAGEGFCIVTDKGEYRAKQYWRLPGQCMLNWGCPVKRNWLEWGFLIVLHATGLFLETVWWQW